MWNDSGKEGLPHSPFEGRTVGAGGDGIAEPPSAFERRVAERLGRGDGLSRLQRSLFGQYLSHGHLRAIVERCAGKTFLLAHIAAMELLAGRTVSYRSLSRAVTNDTFLADLRRRLGGDIVNKFRKDGRLVLPSPNGTHGVRVDVDLQDEPWLVGHPWIPGAVRCAALGSLPDDVIVVGPLSPSSTAAGEVFARDYGDFGDNPFLRARQGPVADMSFETILSSDSSGGVSGSFAGQQYADGVMITAASPVTPSAGRSPPRNLCREVDDQDDVTPDIVVG